MEIKLPPGLGSNSSRSQDYSGLDRAEEIQQEREELSGERQMAESAKQATRKAGGATVKVASAATNLILKKALWPRLIIVGAIIAVILLIIGSIFGAVNHMANVQSDIASVTESECGNPSPDLWDLSGVANPEDFIDELLGTQTCQNLGSAPGSGFTGEVYPPTVGLLTSEFPASRSGGRGHGAIDIAGGCGVPVFAYAGGTVVRYEPGSESMGMQPGGGVVIEHAPDFYTLYWHMRGSEMTVKEGDIVSAGQQIGKQFSNGQSSGCHLHFEMSKSNPRITEADVFDPLPVLHADGFMYARDLYFSELPEAPIPGGPAGVAGGSGGTGANTDPKKYALEQVKANGWAEREFTQCLLPLWEKESNWRVNALNPAFSPGRPAIPGYQAYGIPQSGPGSKMASEGSDWKTNAQTQIRWGLGYIRDRYQTPCNAWAHSQRVNWY